MTNTVTILIYLPLLMINALLFSSIIRKEEKLFVDRFYTLLGILLLGWQIMELLFYALKNPFAIEVTFSAKFLFAAFIPPVFLFLVAGFYHLNKKISGWMYACILIIPVLTAIIAVTAPCHSLFRKSFELVSTHPLTIVVCSRGIWYYVNVIYSQIPVLAAICIFLTQYKKLPRAYRTNANLLLVGLFLYMIGIVVEIIIMQGKHPLDFNLIGICLCNFLFYIGVSSNGRADYLNIWRRDIFDYLDEAVLILNDSGVIVEANLPAMKLFEDLGGQIEGMTLDKLTQAAAASGFYIRALRDEDGQEIGRDLYWTKGKYPLVYNIQQQALPRETCTLGEFVSLTEVTSNRLLIERLRETVGVDPLTGLKNRFGFEAALRGLDLPENLPISVIISDVNNLKWVNDNLGHAVGDDMLRHVAELLRALSPEESYLARIGGDEFLVILKSCPETEALHLIEALRRQIASLSELPYPLSVALGCATKTRQDENLSLLIRKADEKMYANKRARGGGR